MNKKLISLIAGGVVALYSGRSDANEAGVVVPEGINEYNVETFRQELYAPLDSLNALVQKSSEAIAGSTDDAGARKSRELLLKLGARRDSLETATTSIGNEVVPKLENFNSTVRDNLVTNEEADSLLSKIQLDHESIDAYYMISGTVTTSALVTSDAYARLDETVARFNADVDTLLGRLEGVQVAKIPEARKKEKEYDYTLMEKPKLEVIAGSAYGDDIVSLNLGFRTPIYNRIRAGLSAEYGEQPGNTSDVTLHQRGRLTGFRAEASQVVDKSLLGVSAELAYGDELYGLISAGPVKRFTEVEKEEKLYDRDNNLLGSDSSKDTNEKWYGRFMAGVGYRNGSLGFEGSAGVIGRKNAAARFNISYNF